MPKPRTELRENETKRQTDQSTGCLSGFVIPFLIVLCIGIVFVSGASSLSVNRSAGTLQDQNKIAPLFTAEVQFWSEKIVKWSAEQGIDPNIAATVMQIESCGNPDAQSNSGAMGLFQVMPFHFVEGENAFDPEINALRGLSYLSKSQGLSNNDVRLSLAGYNGGIGMIAEPETNWADETIRYVYWGSGIYSDATQNSTRSARLDEWLAAGGDSLCAAARVRLGLAQ